MQPCITVTGISMDRDYKAKSPSVIFLWVLLPFTPKSLGWNCDFTQLKNLWGILVRPEFSWWTWRYFNPWLQHTPCSLVCISDTTKNVPSIPLTFLHFKGSSDIFHFLPPEENGMLSNNSVLLAHPSNFQYSSISCVVIFIPK